MIRNNVDLCEENYHPIANNCRSRKAQIPIRNEQMKVHQNQMVVEVNDLKIIYFNHDGYLAVYDTDTKCWLCTLIILGQQEYRKDVDENMIVAIISEIMMDENIEEKLSGRNMDAFHLAVQIIDHIM